MDMRPIAAILDKWTATSIAQHCSVLLEEKNFLHLSVALDSLRSILQVVRTMYKEPEGSTNQRLAATLQANIYYEPTAFFEMIHKVGSHISSSLLSSPLPSLLLLSYSLLFLVRVPSFLSSLLTLGSCSCSCSCSCSLVSSSILFFFSIHSLLGKGD
jgi:hypothetical protein